MSVAAARPAGRALRGASVLLVATMAASFTPTPLYPRYEARWDLAPTQLSVVFAAYAAGVLVVLLSLGGLADRVGRLVALRWSGALLVLALLVLATAPAFWALVTGRLLQGLATGVITTAGAAAMAELHPRGPHAGSLRYTLALALGVAAGPLLAGSVATRLPWPTATPYLLVAAVTTAAVLVLLVAPVAEVSGERGRLLGGIGVPRTARAGFAAAAAAVASTNVCLGVMGTFGPEVARSLGWTSSAAAGALVSLVLVPLAAAQLAGRAVPLRASLVLGGLVGSLGWVGLLVGVAAERPGVVLAGCVLLGVGAGLGLLSSAAQIAAVAPPGRRAGLQAAYLVSAFTVLAFSSLLLGPVLSRASLTTALALVLVLSLVLAALSAALVARSGAPVTGSTRA